MSYLPDSHMDKQILELLILCQKALEENRHRFLDQSVIRWQRMVDSINDLIDAVETGTLFRKAPYLSITQMIERDDPEEVIKRVVEVGKFYQKHFKEPGI